MEFVTDTAKLTEIIKDYLKKNKITAKSFASLLGKDPAYLSRFMNHKHEISADMMFKLLKHMGYEVVLMNKKEKNLLEKEAYAELSKGMGHLREEIREGLVSEIENDLIKSISNYFREHGPKSNRTK